MHIIAGNRVGRARTGYDVSDGNAAAVLGAAHDAEPEAGRAARQPHQHVRRRVRAARAARYHLPARTHYCYITYCRPRSLAEVVHLEQKRFYF